MTRLAFDEFGWNDPMSCKSTILADVDNTPKKLMTANTWTLIEEIHSFYY